ncbi:MAG: hypothetical protein MI923_05495 [Phycisphaerales bacterium]|nr:hypothetical protein [Phycisphaerales bacterium]
MKRTGSPTRMDLRRYAGQDGFFPLNDQTRAGGGMALARQRSGQRSEWSGQPVECGWCCDVAVRI